MYLKKTAAYTLQSFVVLLLLLILAACGDAPPAVVTSTPTVGPTNTPVIIVVTATPEPATNTVVPTPEPPTPTTLAELPTAIIILAPDPTETAPPPVAPPAAGALTYQGIVAHYQTLLPAQQRQYTDSLVGQRVTNWHGWVDIARKQFTSSDGEVKLDMDSADPNNSSWDVRVLIPETDVEKFSRRQELYFAGTITGVICGPLDCDVDLKDATFSSAPTGQAQPSSQEPTTAPNVPAPILPTDTPAPPPPTNTPLGPAASIEAGIRRYASDVELQGVEYNGTSINIVFKVRDNITSNLRKLGAQRDVTNILRGAAEGAPATYTQIWIRGTFPLKDNFGNVEDGQVLNLRYDKPTIERINWEGFNWKDIYKIADKAIVHPDLQP